MIFSRNCFTNIGLGQSAGERVAGKRRVAPAPSMARQKQRRFDNDGESDRVSSTPRSPPTSAIGEKRQLPASPRVERKRAKTRDNSELSREHTDALRDEALAADARAIDRGRADTSSDASRGGQQCH